jgi:hypothetical protein
VAFTDGQLPAKVNADKTLTGTFGGEEITGVVVTLDDGQGGTFDFNATLDADAKTWSAVVSIAGLADNAYSVRATATDLVENPTTANGAGQLTVDTVTNVTVNDVLSDANTPTLTGTVDTDVATLEVTVAGATYTLADGDITRDGAAWSLALPATVDGNYTVSVASTDDAGNTDTAEGQLVIDTI